MAMTAEQHRLLSKVDKLIALVVPLETQLAASRATAANRLSALVAELTVAGANGAPHPSLGQPIGLEWCRAFGPPTPAVPLAKQRRLVAKMEQPVALVDGWVTRARPLVPPPRTSSFRLAIQPRIRCRRRCGRPGCPGVADSEARGAGWFHRREWRVR